MPRRFAISGLVLGFISMGLWWFDYVYNPFHYPTAQEAQSLAVFPVHPVHNIFETVVVILCPGLIFRVFAVGAGSAFAVILWVFAAVLNWPIYYAIGFLAALLLKRQTAV
jgi:hypothetical protein